MRKKIFLGGGLLAAVGIGVIPAASAMDFGDMMNPSKWMGGNRGRDYYDDRGYGYGAPGYGYGVPGYGYGAPGYGYGVPGYGYGVPGYGYGAPGYGYGVPGYGYGVPGYDSRYQAAPNAGTDTRPQ